MEELSRDPKGDKEPAAESAARKREQWFRFGPWVFDVNKGLAIVAESPRGARLMPVEPWARFYGLAKGEADAFPVFGVRDIDKMLAMTADLRRPLLMATMRNQGGEEFPLVIDGTHRIYRAYVEGIAELPAFLLTVEETLAIRADGLLGDVEQRGGRPA